jgi:23S rRNA (pseudouridine1915-N3)-methyltransferase
MKFEFWCIGKPHDVYIKYGADHFTKRINKYFSVQWRIIATPKNSAFLREEELKKQEADLILEALQPKDFLILLDGKGKQLTSVQLAEFIQQKANESKQKLIFLTGGVFGVHEKIMQRSNFIWSLSLLVFPHMLVRLILAEQVYRACTILKNEKYHHV